MEIITIDGLKAGQSMSVDYETYQEMKALFLDTVWDNTGDFSGADWHFEGRFFFHIWLFEELNGLTH
jgi:hypothetical protein